VEAVEEVETEEGEVLTLVGVGVIVADFVEDEGEEVAAVVGLLLIFEFFGMYLANYIPRHSI
jgi:hypothetical protein